MYSSQSITNINLLSRTEISCDLACCSIIKRVSFCTTLPVVQCFTSLNHCVSACQTCSFPIKSCRAVRFWITLWTPVYHSVHFYSQFILHVFTSHLFSSPFWRLGCLTIYWFNSFLPLWCTCSLCVCLHSCVRVLGHSCFQPLIQYFAVS